MTSGHSCISRIEFCTDTNVSVTCMPCCVHEPASSGKMLTWPQAMEGSITRLSERGAAAAASGDMMEAPESMGAEEVLQGGHSRGSSIPPPWEDKDDKGPYAQVHWLDVPNVWTSHSPQSTPVVM